MLDQFRNSTGETMATVRHLKLLLQKLGEEDQKIILSTPAEPRRASVGVLLRIRNNNVPLEQLLQTEDAPIDLELLYIRRAYNPRDRWSCHMAFPGGKQERGESDRECCEREWQEEVGIDLHQFQYLGRLDDREVKAMASSKRVMVLCCFVYLQVIDAPLEFTVNPQEISSVYWIPCNYLVDPKARWDPIPFEISRHLSSRMPGAFEPLLSTFFGKVVFFGVDAPIEHRVLVAKEYETAYKQKYPIWGLTLWMTSDLLSLIGLGKIAQHGGPQYSAVDVDLCISILSGKKRTLETFLHRERVNLGLSTVHAVRVAVALGLGLRIVFLYQASRWTMRAVRRLCSL
jgi:8-oxo-dGTP pyrophosphatase MutT (NUDIX family)